MTSGALGIIPVAVDDRSAPLGCAALRTLRGRPLLAWAARALTSSDVVPFSLVAVPSALEEAVADVLRTESPERIEILPVEAGACGVRAALESPWAGRSVVGDEVVVVHDPLYPLSSPDLVPAVVDGLVAGRGAAGCVPGRLVTDTLKWVDEDGVVRGTVDREGYRVVCTPQAYRREALRAALVAASDDALRGYGVDALPRLVQAVGGSVTLVPSPGEVFRVAGQDDLVLVEALLQVEAGR